MNRPAAKGWCPSAHRPMMSGDGLVVRIRPRLGRLTRDQVLGLCTAARRFGSGMIDLTNRANLQLRGVTEENHAALVTELEALDLVDSNPAHEARRNIVTAPLWQTGNETERLAHELAVRVTALPDLPVKFGFAVDAGDAPILGSVSADIRIERGQSGGLIVRADGATQGQSVSFDDAVAATAELADWFLQTGGTDSRRMARHLRATPLPAEMQQEAPAEAVQPLVPGMTSHGLACGAPLGQTTAAALEKLIHLSDATAIRITPWRLFILEGAQETATNDFITAPGNPLLNVDACPGAPFCASAKVETRDLARALASNGMQGLHISGCSKGCARPRATHTTLVGRDDGRFDLVRDGCAWDTPALSGLTADELVHGSESL